MSYSFSCPCFSNILRPLNTSGVLIVNYETLAEAYEWLEVELPNKSVGGDDKYPRLNRGISSTNSNLKGKESRDG